LHRSGQQPGFRDRCEGLALNARSGGERRMVEKTSGKSAGKRAAGRTTGKAGTQPGRASVKPAASPQQPVLLSGGNPQIAKGYGAAPVQAYIAAMPGWKQDLGRRLDALITAAIPGVRKAVKWNSPFYGVEDGAWFASFHCFTRYVKVTFFRGTSLHPIPPGSS